jgi:hypothetical protein
MTRLPNTRAIGVHLLCNREQAIRWITQGPSSAVESIQLDGLAGMAALSLGLGKADDNSAPRGELRTQRRGGRQVVEKLQRCEKRKNHANPDGSAFLLRSPDRLLSVLGVDALRRAGSRMVVGPREQCGLNCEPARAFESTA